MIDFDWKHEIQQWVEKKKKIRLFQNDLIRLFERCFQYTSFPDKALFGTNSYSISLLTGGIFFVACTREGIVWLLLDRPFDDLAYSNSTIVKSTKNFLNPLYWLEIEDLVIIKDILNRQDIWDSYLKATGKIYKSKMVTSYRSHIAKNKIALSDFYTLDFQSLGHLPVRSINEIEEELELELQKARKLSKKERHELIKKSDPKPLKIVVKHSAFIRNQYVIAEVLDRANGICERCKKPAPFLRDSDNSSYLEVHHIKPLAEGGLDTVENTLALCPNCHRQAHYGKITY